MKNKAFTLAEILIVLTLIGIISIVMIRSTRSDNIDEKTNIAKAYKAIEVFDEASANVRDMGNKTDCPMGTLMYTTGKKADGTYDYEIGLNLDADNKENSFFNIYSNYVKYEKTGLNFCNFSKYCSNNSITTPIPAVKISGDTYVGIQILDSVSDCPNFYLPEVSGVITQRTKLKGGKAQCWAKLYIDTNGLNGPNTLGKDVFVFGMDENGINH